MAQNIYAQYSFVGISKDEGLSHNNVECILQDSDGFIWFGTRNGLCRYDGYEMKIFRHTSDSNSLSGSRILSLAEDKEGYLWIGTHQNGLTKFDRKYNVFTRYGGESGIGSQIYRIKVLSDSNVYIGSNDGLTIYNPKNDRFTKHVPVNKPYSLNSFLVSDILETRDGEIYIATWEDDIQRFEPESGNFYSISYIKTDQSVINYRKRLLEDTDGNLWIAAQIHGLYKYNRETHEVTHFKKAEGELNSEVLNGDMLLNTDGKIWVTTDGGGINIIDPQTETFQYITAHNRMEGSLPGDQVYTLFLDNENRVWVGTYDKGAAFFDPFMNKFRNAQIPEHIYEFFLGKSIISLLQDSRGTIWIGTDGDGLHALDPSNRLTSYYPNEKDKTSISSNVITALEESANGHLLIGTYAGGLSVLNPERQIFKNYLPEQGNFSGIHAEHVWTLLSDSRGTNWLGLLGNGADVFNENTETFKNIGPYSNELIQVGHPNVMCLLEDAEGDIWFGTEGAGIFVYDRQVNKMMRITSSPSSHMLTNGIIKDLYLDSHGEIWIATEGTGLFKYNDATKELIQYTIEDGLPGMIIMGVNEDHSGNIWVSTYDGLALMRNNSDTFISFYKYDGLTSNEFNAEAFIQSSNGTFFIGSANGLNAFDPFSITFNQNIPRVFISKLSVLNHEVTPDDTIHNRQILDKSILYTQAITLGYQDKSFSLEFVALNYTHPQKCLYKYKLEGFDEEWIVTDYSRRYASYSNLPEGKYVFNVLASNNDGKWGNNLTRLEIHVLPPFWKTRWFIALLVLLTVVTVLMGYLYRIRRIKRRFLKQQAEKEKRIIELEKENIENELEKLTYYTVNRNRVLVNYKNRLNALSVKAKESVKNGLHMVIDDIEKEIANDTEWKYIEPRLDKFYNSFITKLREKHPELTLSEIKVASYVRMNLTSKEIAEFMHKTIRAVENDRYRLRKKVNLPANESLQHYLMNL